MQLYLLNKLCFAIANGLFLVFINIFTSETLMIAFVVNYSFLPVIKLQLHHVTTNKPSLLTAKLCLAYV